MNNYHETLHQRRNEENANTVDYISGFVKKLSSIQDNAFLDKAPCPVCSSVGRKIFEKRLGIYSYCDSCEHVFLSKILKPEYLYEWYAGHPPNTLSWHDRESDFYKDIYNSGISMIKTVSSKYEKPPSVLKLLDVGCSSGFFMSQATLLGFDTYGVELHRIESEYAVQHGCNILGETIDDIPKDSSFDVITLWDVLEHIPNPVEHLIALKKLLSPGGILFFQVPSSDSLAAKVLRRDCKMFDGIEHVTLLSQKSVNVLLQKANFKLESLSTVIPETHCLSNLISYSEDLYTSQPNRQFTDLLQISEEQILKRNLGYKFQVCAS